MSKDTIPKPSDIIDEKTSIVKRIVAPITKSEYSSKNQESSYRFVRTTVLGLAISPLILDGLNFVLGFLPILIQLPEEYKTQEIVLATGILLAIDKYLRSE